MKKPIPYYVTLLATLFSLLLNMIPVVLLWEQAGVTVFSSLPLLCMAYAVFIGLGACARKSTNSLFWFGERRHSFLFSEKEYTLSKNHDREFRWMLLVYFLPVPCYLPIILLANSAADMLWALLVLFAPQIVYMIIDGKALVKEVKKDVREQKEKKAKQERERLEQERREELGRWK